MHIGITFIFKWQAQNLNFRTVKIFEHSDSISINETTCSPDAFQRGGGQKIVGFSFYGDPSSTVGIQRGYFGGISENLQLIQIYYPNWIMRVYVHLDDSDPVFNALCRLACSNPNLDICDVKDLPGTPLKDTSKVFAMNWRFFPTLDPQVWSNILFRFIGTFNIEGW